MNPSYCECTGCRFPNSHVTAGHKCGKCGKFGHGVTECTRPILKNALAPYLAERLPQMLHCTKTVCEYRWSHNDMAHHCPKCKQNHSVDVCPLNPRVVPVQNLEICCPLCKTDNKIPSNQMKITGLSETCKVCMGNECQVLFPQCFHICVCIDCANELNTNKSTFLQGGTQVQVSESASASAPLARKPLDDSDIITPDTQSTLVVLLNAGNQKLGVRSDKVYTIMYAGQGCSLYVRRDTFSNDKPVELKGFFMHTDAWGQYGIESDNTLKLQMFTNGYTKIE